MPIHNKEISEILQEVADLLDLSGESSFRVRSYRNAARTISGMPQSIASGNNQSLSDLPGIGQSMASKVREIVRTGQLEQLSRLRQKLPPGLIQIMKLEKLGPRRTRLLYDKLKIHTLDELKEAAQSGKLEKLKGFGKKSAEHILLEIEQFAQKGGSNRIKLSEAAEIIPPLLEYLRQLIPDITVAGSYRRGKDTIGDIDLVGSCSKTTAAMNHFVEYENVQRVVSKGKTRASVKLRSGIQADLRIIKESSFGAALLYFTGSQPHTVALRKIAREKGYKLNEYGIYHEKTLLASQTEKQVYETLGLIYIEPELREDQGEIEAARNQSLPELISLEHIRGDLHSHTDATDGKNSLEEMALAAGQKGYEYFAVTDHSRRVAMARGLDPQRLEQQIMQIDQINRKIRTPRILKGIEVDILEDGSLDLPDSILKELDLVIGAAHYNRNLSREKQTRRILKAMENPHFNILAHPTGRMIGKRNEFDIDMATILKEASNNGCIMEINCNPERLDLNDQNIRHARETGVMFSIATDAHSIVNLENMKYGLLQARRGWLSPEHVINTLPLKELKKLLKRI